MQPPGSYITNSYDNNARTLRTTLFTSANSELNDHEYVYNASNQRTKQTRTDNSHVNYTYDNAGQVITALTTNSSGSAIAAEKYLFQYDAAWNMTKRTNNATVSTYSVNNLNQNLSETYDANGNPAGDGVNDWFYFDDENRLIGIEHYVAWKLEFKYDARGRMRSREYFSWSDEGWVGGGETTFIYDGMLIMQERTPVNRITYTRGPDLSISIHGAGGIGGLLALTGTGVIGTNLYYHADANGNVTYLVRTNQTLGATYKYDPFGRTISSSGTYANLNTMRFSSKRIDTETGYYYYGYRFYDPNTQRWLNRDPLEEIASSNLYLFVGNNPVNDYDPNGLLSCKEKCRVTRWICTAAIVAGNTLCVRLIAAPCIVACGASGPIAPACIIACVAGAQVACGTLILAPRVWCRKQYEDCVSKCPCE